MLTHDSGNYLWSVALGGAAGAVLQYVLLVTVAPRVSTYRVSLVLTAIASGLLGIVVAAHPSDHTYAVVGVGFLGTLAPLSASAHRTLQGAGEHRLSAAMLRFASLVLTGSAMATIGYVAVDASTIIFEKVPLPMQ